MNAITRDAMGYLGWIESPAGPLAFVQADGRLVWGW